MGRHLKVIEPAAVNRPVTRPVKVAMRRSRTRSKTVLSCFAFSAAMGFVLVTAVDPYSGATASPYYQPASRFGGERAQALSITGTYANAVTRDNFTVTEKPKPPPPPPVEAKKKFAAPAAAVPDPGSAQAYAYGAVAARGWGEDQYSCLVSLWSRESGWRVNAMNSSSGAYGIPQALPGSKMATAGSDWETNAATQIEWGLGYISGRYGTPCGAWAHSEDIGWY